MKPFVGSVVSSDPVSLGNASFILSRFVPSDTGASRETSAYLKRTSESFSELFRFHRKIDSKRGKKKKRDTTAEAPDGGNVTEAEEISNPSRRMGLAAKDCNKGGIFEDYGGSIGMRKKRRDDGRGGGIGGLVEAKVEDEKNSSERRNEKKKRMRMS